MRSTASTNRARPRRLRSAGPFRAVSVPLRNTGSMTLKRALAANRWLRAQFAILILAAAYMPVAAVLSAAFGSTWVLAPVAVYAPSGGVCWVLARRTERVLKAARVAAERESAELRTPRAPDAGPDQCPVCGGFGLTDLAKDDVLMERRDRAKVVAWGRKRAHRDCAEWSPYVPTAKEKERDTHFRTHFREHRGTRRDIRCDWCFVEDVRWEEKETQRRFEQSWPELMEPTARGARQIRINREADPELRHWLINLGAPSRHMDILAIESCEKAPDGFGWIAHLAEPLRHGLYAVTSSSWNIEPHGRRMMPLDSERLWNTEAGRPFTRTELGLCDCAPPVTAGRLRASVATQPFRWRGMDAEVWEAGRAPCRRPSAPADWKALGEDFDREYGDIWPELKGWRR